MCFFSGALNFSGDSKLLSNPAREKFWRNSWSWSDTCLLPAIFLACCTFCSSVTKTLFHVCAAWWYLNCFNMLIRCCGECLPAIACDRTVPINEQQCTAVLWPTLHTPSRTLWRAFLELHFPTWILAKNADTPLYLVTLQAGADLRVYLIKLG